MIPAPADGWSPELALLLACARRDLTDADRAAADRAVGRGIDWAALAALAERHGLVPLLHRHLAAGADRRVPAAPLAALADRARAIAQRNLHLASELGRVVRTLDAARVPVVALKGPALAHALYGSVALRRINDLDVLVPGDAVGDALAALDAAGWVPDATTRAVRGGDRALGATLHHYGLRGPSGRYRVEVHVLFLPPVARPRVGFAAIADRLDAVELLGVRLPVLQPEELLAHLCVHGHTHGWERLEWVGGVAALLRRGTVRDWARVRAFADRLGGAARLEGGLLLARALVDAPVPAAAGTPSRRAEATAAWIVARLRRDPAMRLTPLERLRHELRADAGVADRARRVWATVATPYPADVAALRLPPPLRPLYPALRPLRLAVRQARRVLAGARPGDRRG